MEKEKKLVIISVIVMTLIVCGIGAYGIISYKTPRDNTKDVEKKKEIVSTIILDINPSIKIDLDKDNKIINITPLNDDAKDIVPSDLEGKELKEAIVEITDKLVEKGYTKEEVVILVNTTGEIKAPEVETVIKDTFVAKEIEVSVIAQELSETAKEEAEKYNITESKASYIEEVLKEKENLTFEELKDKSIDELNKIKNEPVPTPTPVPTQKPSGGNSGTTQPKTSSCTPPSDLKSKEWCTFNVSRPQWCEYNYPQKINNTSNLMEQQLTRLGIEPFSALNRYSTETKYEGSSYCLAIKMQIADRNYSYTLLLDSVTGDLLKETKTKVPALIDENVVKQKALQHFNLKEEEVVMMWVSTDIEGSGGPGEYYRHQVNIEMPGKQMYTANYNAVTGELVTERIWQNIVN